MEYQKMLLGDNTYFLSIVNASYQIHCHNEIEIVYCIEGPVSVKVNETEYVLNNKDILLVDNLALHSFNIENGASILDIELGSQFIGPYYNTFTQRTFISPLIRADERPIGRKNPLKKLLEKIIKEYSSPDESTPWLLRAYLNELFALINRHLPMKEAEIPPHSKKFDKYIRLQRVFDHVQGHYSENITVEAAAKLAGYDPHAFCKLFKTVTGVSFHNYLNSHRINMAKSLLEYKSYSMVDIGEMVGIPVPKSFSRLFKAHTGISPSQYRNDLQKSGKIG